MASLLTSYYNLPPNADGVPPIVRLSQNEHGRELIFTILSYDDINTAGSVVTLNGIKPDGNLYSAPCEINGRIITVTEDVQLTAVYGKWLAIIRVELAGRVLYTGKIVFQIEPDPLNCNRVPSESVLTGVIERCEQAARQADEIKTYLDNYIEGLANGDEVAY